MKRTFLSIFSFGIFLNLVFPGWAMMEEDRSSGKGNGTIYRASVGGSAAPSIPSASESHREDLEEEVEDGEGTCSSSFSARGDEEESSEEGFYESASAGEGSSSSSVSAGSVQPDLNPSNFSEAVLRNAQNYPGAGYHYSNPLGKWVFVSQPPYQWLGAGDDRYEWSNPKGIWVLVKDRPPVGWGWNALKGATEKIPENRWVRWGAGQEYVFHYVLWRWKLLAR